MSEAKTPILGDKPWWESWTAWGALIYAVALAVAEAGVLPPKVTAALQALGGLLAIFGIRRAVGKQSG